MSGYDDTDLPEDRDEAAPGAGEQSCGESPGEAVSSDGAPERPAEAPSDEAEREASYEEAAEEAADADIPPLPAVLEAVLLVTDEPVPAVVLAQVVERPTGEVESVLQQLAEDYAARDRGFELRNVAGGWRLYTRADCAPFVERFVLDGQQARLTQAALETLAVIAYRQPVTRQRVSAVRGVNVDGVVRTLVARGLVTEAGADEDTGATRYRTTNYFLERLGLQSLDELPSLAPLLPELDDIGLDSSSS
ncbi:MAG: SMC-Scp complex subunit ScpB [Mycobacteriales bacterium]